MSRHYGQRSRLPGFRQMKWSPWIHGELLKLGIDISERTVAWLMPQRKKPRSQTWRAFLGNHLKDLVAVDFLVPRRADGNPTETC